MNQLVMWRIIYISYAVFLLIWFCYYVFLSLYFRKMLLIYSQCILQLQERQNRQLWLMCTGLMLVIFIGSMHFFIYNAIEDVLLLQDREWAIGVFNHSLVLRVFIKVLQFFELMIPLLCGLFLIYII